MKNIKAGFTVFVEGREDAVGIVCTVAAEGRPELLMHVRGIGEFAVPFDEVAGVSNDNVFLSERKLDPRILKAIPDPAEPVPPAG